MSVESITSFRILGLFGAIDTVIGFENNTLVIVGPNGTGKSTIVSIFYYFMSAQWSKLSGYDFLEIELNAGGNVVRLRKEELEQSSVINRAVMDLLRPHMPIRIALRFNEFVLGSDVDSIPRGERLIRHWFERNGFNLPSDLIQEVASECFFSLRRAPTRNLGEIEYFLKSLGFTFVFLPTYRRIEKDIERLIPSVNSRHKYERGGRLSSRRNRYHFVEFVEFGMRDVDDLINSKMRFLKASFQADVSKMTGEYLRDIIQRHEVEQSYMYEDIYEENPQFLKDAINSVLLRMGGDVFTPTERDTLNLVIDRISSSEQSSDLDDVLLLISKLLSVYDKQRKREQCIYDLLHVVEQYLEDKEFRFRVDVFELDMFRINADKKIKLQDLSSGEKQIVSLFSHLYLGGTENNFIIIDEPELSISVKWQKRFLEDLWENDFCAGLVAVTHSPFVYQNELKNYTHSIFEFCENLIEDGDLENVESILSGD